MTDKMWDHYLKDMRDAVSWARGSRNDMMNKVLDILVDLNINLMYFLKSIILITTLIEILLTMLEYFVKELLTNMKIILFLLLYQ